MKIFVIIFLFYILSSTLLYLISKYSRKYGVVSDDIYLCFIPGISIFGLIYISISYISNKLNDAALKSLTRKVERRRNKLLKEKYKKDLKIRDDKIKLGIIKITPIDPYGEENWEK